MTAFKNLPPWQVVVKGRDSDMLRMRLDFTSLLQRMRSRTMAKYTDMKTPEEEAAAHERWSTEQALRPKKPRLEGPLRPCPGCSS